MVRLYRAEFSHSLGPERKWRAIYRGRTLARAERSRRHPLT